MRITLSTRAWIAVALALASTTACLDEPTVVDPDARGATFDLAAFVEYQGETLAGAAMQKSVRIGDVDQTLRIDSVDWAAELAPFAEANLNKPALLDKYAVDSTRANDGGLRLNYSALDSAIKVRTLTVDCGADCTYGNVRRVEITMVSSTIIADTEQRYVWTPEGYEIYNKQDALLADPRELFLSGKPLIE